MRTFSSSSFDVLYKEVLALLVSGVSETVVSSKGENLEIRNVILELTDHKNFELDFSKTGLPERQRVYDGYLKRELDWYLNGRNNELHYKNTPFPAAWKKLADASNKIVSNYGYMILREKKAFGQGHGKSRTTTTSYLYCLAQLKEKSSTRQAILHYNLPKHFSKRHKDIPCTIAGQIFIRSNQLHMTVFQRSSDVFTGLAYDVPWHSKLMDLFIKDLYGTYPGLSGGTLTLICSSLHLYLHNRDQALKISQNMKLQRSVA